MITPAPDPTAELRADVERSRRTLEDYRTRLAAAEDEAEHCRRVINDMTPALDRLTRRLEEREGNP